MMSYFCSLRPRGRWAEGSIAAAGVTFLLMATFPFSALGDSAVRSTGSVQDLQGTYRVSSVGIFFPPTASLVAIPGTGRDKIGGTADDLKGIPAILEIRRDPNAIEVYRSPIDRTFELNPDRGSVKPLRFEF